MATNAKQLACQLEDLTQLDSKPFNKYPRGYLQAVKKRLTDTEYSTFLEIKEESFKNYKTGGLVVKSAYEIAKSRYRSSRTIERHLSSIKAKGFIDLEQLKSGKGVYRRNHIKLSCPRDVLEEILNSSQDIVKPSQKTSTGYLCPTKMSEYSDKNVEHSLYNKIIDKSVINTNIRENSLLTNLEPCFDDIEEPADVPRETSGIKIQSEYELVRSGESTPKPNVELEPVAIVPEPQPAENFEPVETACFVNEAGPENFKPHEFDGFKTEAEVARFITKAERVEITKKLKAMRKAGEMHSSVQARYQDILVLIQEVIFFCMYRPKYYRSFKHAKNYAALALRNGSWSTPKKLEWERTQMRERQAQFEKQREQQAYVGSGIAQRLGQTLRENYAGLSERDLNKAKAGIVGQGLAELGSNATVEQIRAFTETVKQRFESPNKAQNTPIEREYPTHEQNVIWYAGLKDEDKNTYYEYAVRKHAGFAKTLETYGLDYRTEGFLKTPWFKMMMELIGKAK